MGVTVGDKLSQKGKDIAIIVIMCRKGGIVREGGRVIRNSSSDPRIWQKAIQGHSVGIGKMKLSGTMERRISRNRGFWVRHRIWERIYYRRGGYHTLLGFSEGNGRIR